ncbi:NAD(P)/FAD-dependent oxidoreductase [Streptomyces sp. DSM 42041]|uniref:NAD(P)/FAD-dependent oxidoreductase n=1 Tax=Streptomyces hazeniae TaxID=3075538 RepID=A0ABU2P044_9ACTN|nr:NAD(P)/FAD-dependent oxidoreductase [Streptomyces sp. DSM 42041]MDT0382617.1 NAD(P)/FAD-dependent oxidoreductase [Streptomyces sp. DSM 42041]
MENTTSHWDVVVVGGGPAGACTAGLLAKKGRRVLVLEKEVFPRYHIGESMITGMISVTDELGVTDRIEAEGFEHKPGLSLVWGSEHALWDIKFKEAGPYAHSYHVDRDRFDEILLDRAAELGATVRQGAPVKEPLVEDGRVCGVRYQHDGRTHEARATTVVDASGQGRVVSRHFSDITWHPDLKNLAVWSYFTGTGRLPGDQHGNILVERVKDRTGWFWGIPLGADRMSVGFVAPVEDVRVERGDLEGFFDARLKETEHLRDLLDGSRCVEEYRTARDWSYMAHDYWGPGWVSVGDASCFVDPLLSSGVCLGMLCAVPLADGLDLALDAPEKESRVLDQYADGCRTFHQGITDYVMFFYEQERDKEDYFERAHSIANNPLFTSPRAGFVGLVSGIAGMKSVFGMYGEEAAAAR